MSRNKNADEELFLKECKYIYVFLI